MLFGFLILLSFFIRFSEFTLFLLSFVTRVSDFTRFFKAGILKIWVFNYLEGDFEQAVGGAVEVTTPTGAVRPYTYIEFG